MSRPAKETPAHTLVLNALVDVVRDEREVLADEDSRAIVRSAYEAATSADDRAAVRTAVEDLDSIAEGTDEGAAGRGRTLAAVADAVADERSADGVRATLDHTVSVSFDPRDASVSTFVATGEPDALDALVLPEPVEAAVEEGARLAANGSFDRAAAAFERGVDAAAGGDGSVAARTLAAWASHRAGDDDRALDLVEEALHLDTGAWSAKGVGLAADHRFPDKFRSGKLGARVYLRRSTEVPPGGTVTAAAGIPRDDGVQWTELTGTAECSPIERLAPETRVRLRLSGDFPALPVVDGYYVALGVVDLAVHEARSVEQVFVGGPQGVATTETVRFER